jgi:hypothetical protein
MRIAIAKAVIGIAVLITSGALAMAASAAASDVEEIYVLRSVRETRAQPPTDACATAQSKLADPAWEDHYTFRSIAVHNDDGRVLDTDVKPVGTILGCFGRTADAAILDFYGEAMINGIAAKASGKCHLTKTDFPEKGIRLFACMFELNDLPLEYAGGQLTTNSLTSPQLFGTQSDPAGYTQVSIATIRLWKKRAAQ